MLPGLMPCVAPGVVADRPHEPRRLLQFRRPGKALVPPGKMIALPLVNSPLLSAELILATRRGRVLPIAAASFVEQLTGLMA